MADTVAKTSKALFKSVSNTTGVSVVALMLATFFFLVSNPVTYDFVQDNIASSIPGFPDVVKTGQEPTQIGVAIHTFVFLLLLALFGFAGMKFTN